MTDQSDTPAPPKAKKEETLGESIMVIVQALLLALLVRTFLFQPFNIPSGSMKETLLVGDYIFASKFTYGYSQYSLPFGLIPFSGRIWAGEPQRGDVAVFRNPTATDTDFIKRVIGLPGERVQVKAGVVFINGVAVKREPAPDFEAANVCPQHALTPDVVHKVKAFRETLPNGVSYTTLQCAENPARVGSDMGFPPDFDHNNTKEYVIPPGHYMMMGDNRDNSTDSRFLNAVGYVPLENFVGKARIIFFSVDNPDNASWLQGIIATVTKPWNIRFSRFFTTL